MTTEHSASNCNVTIFFFGNEISFQLYFKNASELLEIKLYKYTGNWTAKNNNEIIKFFTWNFNVQYFICVADDLNLPAVPPIEISVPQNYPYSSPECKTANYSMFYV